MACEVELAEMTQAAHYPGVRSQEYEDKREAYETCMAGQRPQQHHGQRLRDTVIWEIIRKMLENEYPPLVWEEGRFPPRPEPCGLRSIKIRSEMYGNKENGMIFSRKLDEAFAESGVKLADDETYACVVCVVKKPKSVSEALALNPLGVNMGDTTSVNYIMEQAIMEPVMNTIEQDKISYKYKKAKK